MGNPKPLSSVSRAITLVEYLAAQDPQGTPLGTIAGDLAINKATAYNTLATLREHQWVEQDPTTGFYRLSDGIEPVARYRTSTRQRSDQLRPHLERIGRASNELVHLGRLVDTDIVYVDKVEPARPVRVVSAIGRHATAVTTALGRSLIGILRDRDEQLDWYMATPAVRARPPADQRAIREAVIRNFGYLDQRGWTEDIEEFEAGISCVSVPLLADDGANLAVSISAPVERMTPEYRAKLGGLIIAELASLPADIPFRLSSRLRQ